MTQAFLHFIVLLENLEADSLEGKALFWMEPVTYRNSFSCEVIWGVLDSGSKIMLTFCTDIRSLILELPK